MESYSFQIKSIYTNSRIYLQLNYIILYLFTRNIVKVTLRKICGFLNFKTFCIRTGVLLSIFNLTSTILQTSNKRIMGKTTKLVRLFSSIDLSCVWWLVLQLTLKNYDLFFKMRRYRQYLNTLKNKRKTNFVLIT